MKGMKSVGWAYIFPTTILREQTMRGTLFVPFLIKEGKSEGYTPFPIVDNGRKE